MLWLLASTLLLAPPPPLPSAHFGLETLQRGQRGTCYTVFEGTAIEPFDFEVKGLMKNFLGPQKDIVLVKLLGERPTFTGVVSGMSGSPCVLGGKFLGALAYAFSVFAKEPIAGITPIDTMLEVWRLPPEDKPWRLPGSQAARASSAAEGGDAGALRPIATPLMLGGVPDDVRAEFAGALRADGFEPVAAGTAGAAAPAAIEAGPLLPGAAVSAIMVTGDVDIAATGTVTLVQGERVLAFGHPFMGAGPVSLPLARADILNIMASAMRSFKMSVTGPVIGEVTQDRLAAIGGVLGQTAKMVPLQGTVQTPAGTQRFELAVARDPASTPRLVAMGLSAALSGRVDNTERGLVRYTAELRVAGEEALQLGDVFSAQRDSSLLTRAGMAVGRAFAAVWEAPFGPPPDMQVRLEVQVQPSPYEEQVAWLRLDRVRVHPGEQVQAVVALRQVGEQGSATPVQLQRFTLQVPQSWAGQRLQLLAGGEDAAERLAQQIAGPTRPRDRAEVVRYLARQRRGGFVYLQAVRQAEGLQSGGQPMPFVPASAVATFAGDQHRSGMALGIAYEARRARPGVVSEAASTSLEVLPY